MSAEQEEGNSDSQETNPSFKASDYLSLLKTGITPTWWDPIAHHISYDIVNNLFKFCYEVSCGSHDSLMKQALAQLDPSLIVTQKVSSIKRSVERFLKKENADKNEKVMALYGKTVVDNSVGRKCDQLGISRTVLKNLSHNIQSPFPSVGPLTNEIVLELHYFKETHKYSVANLLHWLKSIFNISSVECSVKNFHFKICDLASKKSKLLRSKKKNDLENFLNSSFIFPSRNNFIELNQHVLDWEENNNNMELEKAYKEIEKTVSLLNDARDKIDILTAALDEESDSKLAAFNNLKCLRNDFRLLKTNEEFLNNKLLQAYKQLSDFSPKNVTRKIKRREAKIQSLHDVNKDVRKQLEEALLDKERLCNEYDNSSFSKKLEDVNKLLEVALQKKTQSQKMKWHYKNLTDQWKENAKKHSINSSYESRISELQAQITILEHEKLEVEDKLKDFLNCGVTTKINGRYVDEIRAVYHDLACMGIGYNNMEAVVRTVLSKICEIDVDELPKPTFARMMILEARRVSQIQVAETLLNNYEKSCRTLHTDGTSKFGQHYGTYDIVDEDGTPLVAGIREMVTGDTETQLSVLESILSEIESSLENSEKSVAKKIVSSIKNVMSDRHVVQKKFNSVFQNFRANALPDIINGWSSLSKIEQDKMSNINDFFCGMHFIVGLADQAEVSLKAWDKLLYDENPVGSLAHGGYSISGGESGTLRLIRTLCKSVQTRGCEKSGRMIDFASFLSERGFSSVPLAPFKGNRFNILFYNGGISYFLYDHCKEFFEDVKDENRLLKAVHFDLQVSSFIAGCRSLGLINKLITGPLWRLLESDIHILDLNMHLQKMKNLFSNLAVDSTEFLKGEVTFFQNINISKDDVYEKLISPSPLFDTATKQCLELLFGSFSIITKRMLNDHLEGGKYDNPSEELRIQTKSVSKTNTLAERNFGMLDRLMREKPHANSITYEAIIMSKTNKTSEWRDNLSDTKKTLLMQWARKSTAKQLGDFKKRREEMRKKQNEIRVNKLEFKRKREAKAISLKQSLICSVGQYGGLWLLPQNVDTQLGKLSTDREKREALKVQIQFRQKILPGIDIDKHLFHLSHKGKNKSIQLLTENLKTLITLVNKSTTKIAEEHDFVDTSKNVVPKNKLEAEKERLKSLLAEEYKKIEAKAANNPPKAKKRKVVDHISDTPIVTNLEELIGKRVKHFTVDYDGKEKWFTGTVLCKKCESETELIIKYDCENKLYSFDYSEFLDSLLQLIPLKANELVNAKLRQKFTTEDQSDTWWETGIIIDVDLTEDKNPLFTISYFRCDDDEDENSDISFQNAYDVCKYHIFDDYLNHEIQFY